MRRIWRQATIVLCATAVWQIGLTTARANTDGYVAFVDGTSGAPMLQRWRFDSTLLSYSLVGNPIGAAPAGNTVVALEVNPRTGDIYTQTTDSVLRRWSHNGTSFTNLGSIGNAGRGLAFAADNSVYALNGPTPFAASGPQWLIKFNQSLTVNQYFVGVSGNDVIATGNDIYVGANDNGGRIYHFQDTGSSFSTVDSIPFNGAGEMTLNPALGGKYAAAHGYNKETGASLSGTHWIITGSFSGFPDGKFDANNVGTGFDLVNDLGAGPDGTIFAAQRGAQNWISAWKDRGPAQTPTLLNTAGNSDNRGAWLAVDPASVVGNTIIHTATNDGANQVLRAWGWNGTTINFIPSAGFFGIPGATAMSEIAVIQPVPEPGSIVLVGLSLAAFVVNRSRRQA